MRVLEQRIKIIAILILVINNTLRVKCLSYKYRICRQSSAGCEVNNARTNVCYAAANEKRNRNTKKSLFISWTSQPVLGSLHAGITTEVEKIKRK